MLGNAAVVIRSGSAAEVMLQLVEVLRELSLSCVMILL